MLWQTHDLIRWLLRPSSIPTPLGPEADGALLIAKADLMAEAVTMARLRPVFAAGLVGCLCLGAAVILVGVKPYAPFTFAAVALTVPYALVYFFTAAPLATERLQFQANLVVGLISLIAMLSLVLWYLLGNPAFHWISLGLVLAYTVIHAAAYALALADSAFVDRAETVQTLRQKVAPKDLNGRLTDIHSMQVHLGTFRATLRKADDPARAVESTLAKLPVQGEAGRAEARRQLLAIAAERQKGDAMIAAYQSR